MINEIPKIVKNILMQIEAFLGQIEKEINGRVQLRFSRSNLNKDKRPLQFIN